MPGHPVRQEHLLTFSPYMFMGAAAQTPSEGFPAQAHLAPHSEPLFPRLLSGDLSARNVLVRRAGPQHGKQDASNLQSREKAVMRTAQPPSSKT